jgi:hypothetical protein
LVRGDVVDRLAEFGAVLGIFEDFGPNISEPQAASRTFEQANTELALKVANAAADGRGRHLEAARRFRKTVRFDNLGENHQRIEVRHRYSSCSFRSLLRRDRRTCRGGTLRKSSIPKARRVDSPTHCFIATAPGATHFPKFAEELAVQRTTRIVACSKDYPKFGK